MKRSRVLSEAFAPLEVYEYVSPAMRRRRIMTRVLIVLTLILILLLIRKVFFLPHIQ